MDVTRALGQPLRIEVPLPSDRVAVDLVLDRVVVPGLFGAVGDETVGHVVGVEHFSRPPTQAEALRALIKAGLLRNEFAHDPAVMVTLLVACRKSIGALRRYDLIPDAHICGWWRLNLHVAMVHVLSAKVLPADGSWGAFRFAANPPGSPSQNLTRISHI